VTGVQTCALPISWLLESLNPDHQSNNLEMILKLLGKRFYI
jgi:hypothetical protein